MVKKKFNELDLRDNFEFQVFVSSELSTSKSNGIQFINLSESYPGYLKKEGNDIILDLSTILMKPSAQDKVSTSNLDEVETNYDLGPLYATTWDGNIQFIIRKYFRSKSNQTFMFNAASYGGTSSFVITDISFASQFMLSSLVYKAQLSLDFIHEWFSLYKIQDEFLSNSHSLSLIFNDLFFKDIRFSFSLNSEGKNHMTQRIQTIKLNSIIVIELDTPQNRDFIFDLAIQFRNLFQLILDKDIGLHRIILNENKSLAKNIREPKDERENWFISQSYLPKVPDYTKHSFKILYRDIQHEFDSVLKRYFASEKIRELTSRYLITKQFRTPVISAFLTLSAGVENYFNGEVFTNGTKVKSFETKLNKLFNFSWDSNPNTKDIIKIIKDNRDYYIHGHKKEKKLNELDLIPIYQEFQKAIRNYLLNELCDNLPK